MQSQDEQEPCSVFYEEVNNDTNDAVSYKILDGQHMEEDEIGLLQSSSDLQVCTLSTTYFELGALFVNAFPKCFEITLNYQNY